MNTIKLILDANADGSLHLPLPDELKDSRILIEAKLERIEPLPVRVKTGLWKDLPGPFWMASDFDEPLDDFKEYME